MSTHTPVSGRLTPGPTAPRSPARTFSGHRLIPATAVALVVSLAGVLAIRAAAVSGASDTGRFSPLHPASIVSLTIIGVLLAAAVCLWLGRVAGRPVAAFRTIGLIALPLSVIPDVAIWVAAAFPQTRAATVLPLIAMHVLVAAVCLTVLPRLGDAPAAG